MDKPQTAGNCRWATPSLSLTAPLWLGAWDSPWACLRDAAPRLLDSTEACTHCPRWEPESQAGGHPGERLSAPGRSR
jgi:hypothetical protein